MESVSGDPDTLKGRAPDWTAEDMRKLHDLERKQPAETIVQIIPKTQPLKDLCTGIVEEEHWSNRELEPAPMPHGVTPGKPKKEDEMPKPTSNITIRVPGRVHITPDDDGGMKINIRELTSEECMELVGLFAAAGNRLLAKEQEAALKGDKYAPADQREVG